MNLTFVICAAVGVLWLICMLLDRGEGLVLVATMAALLFLMWGDMRTATSCSQKTEATQ